MSKRNIGIVTTWFPSGAGFVSKAYSEILSLDFNVFIYARQGKRIKRDSNWENSNVYWAKYHYSGISLNDFKRWIKNNNIHLIIFNEQRYWAPIVLAIKMGIKVGAYVDYYTEKTVDLFIIYDFLLCNTKKHFSAFYWHPNVHYIPWGVDVALYKNNFLVKETKKPKFITSIGWEGLTDLDRKGMLLSIKAFKNVIGDCELLIYSQVEFEDLQESYQKIILADSRIHFIVGTFHPFPFSNGDIYLYPSRLDGIGLSLPEALSCGLPAITTDNSPMNEFVVHQYNGLLVKVNLYVSRFDGYYWPQSICDTDSLTEAMQFYINNPDAINVHGKNARKFAIENLNWVKNSSSLGFLINSFLDNKSNILSKKNELKTILIDQYYNPSLSFRFLQLIKTTAIYIIKNLFRLY